MTMWGWGNLEFPITSKTMTREELEEVKLKKEAAQMIEDKGVGVCQYCEEEIYKNDNMAGAGYNWESEFYVGFCPVAKTAKHSPIVKWTPAGGVHPIEP